MTDQNAAAETTPTKPCPFCKESIHSEAMKCKVCGEYLYDKMLGGSAIIERTFKKDEPKPDPPSPPKKRWWPIAVVVIFFSLVLYLSRQPREKEPEPKPPRRPAHAVKRSLPPAPRSRAW